MHKNATMKASFILPAAFILFLAACQILEPPLHMGSPRKDEGLHTVIEDPREPDTVLLVSALCYPPSYDWRKDSLFGRVQCTVKLFRDGEEAVAISAGPGTQVSSSHDAHHIIGGSLYSEYSDSRQTVICCDGVKTASWSGRERLVGLMLRDGVLYTLGCTASDLVYRKNGVELLRICDAVPFGGFRFNTYGPTGALYEYEGAVCFMFLTHQDGNAKVFAALDGELREVFSSPGAEVLDARMTGDGPIVLYNADGVTCLRDGTGSTERLPNSDHIIWEEAEIAMIGGKPAAVGYCRHEGESEGTFWIRRQNYSNRFVINPLAVYFRDGEPVPVYAGKEVPEDSYFLSRDCACLSPCGGLTIAVSPKDKSVKPYVISDSGRQEYDVDGLLTGVSYQIIP